VVSATLTYIYHQHISSNLPREWIIVMSNQRKGVTSSSVPSQKRYVDRNLNSSLTKAPTNSTHGNQQGKLLVLQNNAKSRAVKSAVGVSAAPTPVNTSSLKRENKGKDTSVNLVPVGTTVWGQSSDAKQNDTSPTAPVEEKNASPTAAKPAPWARPSQQESADTTNTQTASADTSSTQRESKMRSWTVDSDDEEEASKPVAVPTYANPAAAAAATSSPMVPHPQARADDSYRTPHMPPQDFRDRHVGPGQGGRQHWQHHGPGPYDGDRGHSHTGDYYNKGARYGHHGGPEGSHYRGDSRHGPQDGRYGRGYGHSHHQEGYGQYGHRGRADHYSRSGGGAFSEPSEWSAGTHHSRGLPPNMSGSMGVAPSNIAPVLDSSNTESMTEEQRALENARLEREQLERRKREEKAKREAEEREKQRLEQERLEKEKQAAAAEAARRQKEEDERWTRKKLPSPPRATPQQQVPPQRGNFGNISPRFSQQRQHQAPHTGGAPYGAHPPAPPHHRYDERGSEREGGPYHHHQGGLRGQQRMGHSGGFPPNRQGPGHIQPPSAGAAPTHIHTRGARHQQEEYRGQSQYVESGRRSRGASEDAGMASATVSGDGGANESARTAATNPTRILQHPPRMLFDHKSGEMVEQSAVSGSNTNKPPTVARRDRGMSESSTSSDKHKGHSEAAWRNAPSSVNGKAGVKAADEHVTEEQRRREKRAAEIRAAALEEQRVKEEKANALREARAKERAERAPRTQGVLYRYAEDGTLERVLTEAEKQEYAARDEARRMEKEYIREKHAEKERKKLAAKKQRKEKLTAAALAEAEKKSEQEVVEASSREITMVEMLEKMEISSDDILQQTVEFVEVKSRRTISQEKRDSKGGRGSESSTSGPSQQREGKGDKISSRNKARGGKDSQGASQGDSPSSDSPPTVAPAPLPLPTKPAWQAPKSTLVDLGVLPADTKVEDTAPAEDVRPAEEGEVKSALRGKNDKKMTRAEKAKERSDRIQMRREIKEKKVKEKEEQKKRKDVADDTTRQSRGGAAKFDTRAAKNYLLSAAMSSAPRKNESDTSENEPATPTEGNVVENESSTVPQDEADVTVVDSNNSPVDNEGDGAEEGGASRVVKGGKGRSRDGSQTSRYGRRGGGSGTGGAKPSPRGRKQDSGEVPTGENAVSGSSGKVPSGESGVSGSSGKGSGRGGGKGGKKNAHAVEGKQSGGPPQSTKAADSSSGGRREGTSGGRGGSGRKSGAGESSRPGRGSGASSSKRGPPATPKGPPARGPPSKSPAQNSSARSQSN